MAATDLDLSIFFQHCDQLMAWCKEESPLELKEYHECLSSLIKRIGIFCAQVQEGHYRQCLYNYRHQLARISYFVSKKAYGKWHQDSSLKSEELADRLEELNDKIMNIFLVEAEEKTVQLFTRKDGDQNQHLNIFSSKHISIFSADDHELQPETHALRSEFVSQIACYSSEGFSIAYVAFHTGKKYKIIDEYSLRTWSNVVVPFIRHTQLGFGAQ